MKLWAVELDSRGSVPGCHPCWATSPLWDSASNQNSLSPLKNNSPGHRVMRPDGAGGKAVGCLAWSMCSVNEGSAPQEQAVRPSPMPEGHMAPRRPSKNMCQINK